MNHTKNNKRSKLTRQGISFLLAFVLMLSVFAPGAAYATGGEGGTADPVPCTVCNVVDCGQTHVWCESHEVWDCREEHPPVNLPLDPVCPGDDSCTIEGCTNHAPKCPGDDTCTIEGCPNHAPKCPGDDSCTIEGCPNHAPQCPGDDSCTIEGCPNHAPKSVCGNCSGEHETKDCVQKMYMYAPAPSFQSGVFFTSASVNTRSAGSTGLTFNKTATANGDGSYNLDLTLKGSVGTQQEKQKLDLIIVIDRSQSMNPSSSHGQDRIGNAKTAARSLITTVNNNASVDARYNIIDFSGSGHPKATDDWVGSKTGQYVVETTGWVGHSAASTGVNNISLGPSRIETATKPNTTTAISYGQPATNYEAAFITVKEQLTSSRPDAMTAIVFLTDGKPTCAWEEIESDYYTSGGWANGYIDGTDGYSDEANWEKHGTTNEQPNNVRKCLGAALNDVDDINADFLYLVGMGSADSATLNTVKSNAAGVGYCEVMIRSYTQIGNAFASIAQKLTSLFYTDVTITDTLSKVDSQLMVKVKQGTAATVTVKKGNDIVAGPSASVNLDATESPVKNNEATLTASSADGVLTLEFPDNYKLNPEYTYILSAVIEPTEKAYRQYREQGNQYLDTGDPETGTHQRDKGFYSNNQATVTYAYGDAKNQAVVYSHPVIQLDPGSLTVSKSFVGLTSDQIADIQDLSFDVTLTYPDDGNGVNDEVEVKRVPFSQMADTDGDGVYTYTITGLSPNTQYSVTESGGTVQGHTPAVTYENASGTVPKGESRTASIVNTYTTELTIGKTVTGNMGDVNLPFAFTVTIGERTETFSLKHGEQTTLRDIPIGADVTITETTSGYTATATLNDTAMEVKEGAVTFLVADIAPDTVWFTNNKTATIDTGVALDSLPYIIILASVAAAAVFLVLRRRSRYED